MNDDLDAILQQYYSYYQTNVDVFLNVLNVFFEPRSFSLLPSADSQSTKQTVPELMAHPVKDAREISDLIHCVSVKSVCITHMIQSCFCCCFSCITQQQQLSLLQAVAALVTTTTTRKKGVGYRRSQQFASSSHHKCVVEHCSATLSNNVSK